jgi:hypothetical protein
VSHESRFELEKEIEDQILKLVTEAREAVAAAKLAEENAKLAAQAAESAKRVVAETCAEAAKQGFRLRWGIETI